MAALAVIQVAGFTGVEVGCGIAIHLAIDVTMLEVGIRVAFLAAVVIGGRNVIHAGAGLQHRRKRVLDLFDARRQCTDLLVIAVDDDEAIHLAHVGDIADQRARVPACAVIAQFPFQGEPLGSRLEREFLAGIRCKVDGQRTASLASKGAPSLVILKVTVVVSVGVNEYARSVTWMTPS